MSQYEFLTLIIDFISLIFVFIGGFFALFQWRKSLVLKRLVLKHILQIILNILVF